MGVSWVVFRPWWQRAPPVKCATPATTQGDAGDLGGGGDLGEHDDADHRRRGRQQRHHQG
jgi:hypothetical protein